MIGLQRHLIEIHYSTFGMLVGQEIHIMNAQLKNLQQLRDAILSV